MQRPSNYSTKITVTSRAWTFHTQRHAIGFHPPAQSLQTGPPVQKHALPSGSQVTSSLAAPSFAPLYSLTPWAPPPINWEASAEGGTFLSCLEVTCPHAHFMEFVTPAFVKCSPHVSSGPLPSPPLVAVGDALSVPWVPSPAPPNPVSVSSPPYPPPAPHSLGSYHTVSWPPHRYFSHPLCPQNQE